MDPRAQANQHVRAAAQAWQSGQFDRVEPHFLEALRLEPDQSEAHEGISQWYFEQRDLRRALHHSEIALRLGPHDPNVIMSRAVVLEGNNEPEAAFQLVEPLLRAGKAYLRLGSIYARVAPAVKRERQAIQYVEMLARSPNVNEAQRAPLLFAAATLYDRLGDYDKAIDLARRSKLRSRGSYDANSFTLWTDRQIAWFTPARFASLPRSSRDDVRPIFIVGMPRSGTSLVEQILAAHPLVFGAGELEALDRVVASAPTAPWAGGKPYPDYLDALTTERANILADAYQSLVPRPPARVRSITDKNPQNFRLVPLIATLFPGARIVHCHRDPIDTCLSCYLTFFAAPGNEATQSAWSWPPAGSLNDLAAYYRDYQRLMRHWTALPGIRVLDVQYEQMVTDADAQVRRLLEFVELPWDQRCVRFYESKRVIATPSERQVRRPVYTSSIGRWKRYEKHLSELVAALSPLHTSVDRGARGA
jgi:tetratricopeptide (TPR) repeat protein